LQGRKKLGLSHWLGHSQRSQSSEVADLKSVKLNGYGPIHSDGRCAVRVVAVTSPLHSLTSGQNVQSPDCSSYRQCESYCVPQSASSSLADSHPRPRPLVRDRRLGKSLGF